ncbi:MAG: 3-hydroxy-3-methylglutaryl-coenzyme A (HMG-CoA) reductase isozyme [Geoglossum umbratile]|nr:MAG: 3-hydroxy-3-methylglutaryl-coenzyme A (HMG-CoA) reductase isozyme [Geoglossum umbratile]
MLGTPLLPAGFRAAANKPFWLSRQITSFLLSLSRRACTHPIHTIVFISLLASTTYIGLLEGSLFDRVGTLDDASSRSEWSSLVEGSRKLWVGPQTGWKWQLDDAGGPSEAAEDAKHLALLTFVFPGSSPTSSHTAPPARSVPLPPNSSAQHLPSTSGPFSSMSQDSTLAFSVPLEETSEFLSFVQEIPSEYKASEASLVHEPDDGGETEQKKWIMKTAKGDGRGSRVTWNRWARNAWAEFVDLLKNAETLDIVIMILGYIAMHLTFVSLFLSMRRMGSNFWLATTVLFSSVFAFLFGLIVTTKLGVPVNMVLLSEGLPFLVVTIGFEKPIILTRAVLTASLSSRRQPVPFGPGLRDGEANDSSNEASPMTIQYAVQAAVKEKGAEIVRDYMIEIVILIAGASSGVQGGLRQFCFLAAWILTFDCLLLFTFYTAILSIKLEINRIKRHVALRKALEEDGVSRRVAENVARSNAWPKFSTEASSNANGLNAEETPVFGKKVRDSSVPKFKVLMVSGFVLVNVLNLCTLPFRNGRNAASAASGLSSMTTPPPMDPFKVAGNGLDVIFASAKSDKKTTTVTILNPIKYELEYPSVHYASRASVHDPTSLLEVEYTEQLLESVGGMVVEGLLKSLEDPVLSKWIVVALAMSLVLNGYLFNAARWSVKDPQPTTKSHSDGSQFQAEPVTTVRDDARESQANGVVGKEERIVATPEPSEKEDDDALVMKSGHANAAAKVELRTQAECDQMLKEKRASELTDRELVDLSLRGKIAGYALEGTLGDPARAVIIRRSVVSRTPSTSATTGLLEQSLLPHANYDYAQVLGACCENVIGYMPLPVGVAGPLVIDGQSYFLPMATTEGVLVASTSRGCKAINAGGGAITVLTGDGMTRGPCISFDTLARAGAAKIWLDSEVGQKVMKDAFNSTSRFARLQSMKTALAGTYLYIRFKTTTGDAMGMNMISKGVEHALKVMATESGFQDMSIISVSGNFCTDKKPAAINWIDGRGKSVVAEAIIPGDIVRNVLKSDVNALIELNVSKNLIGSAMAGSVGGFNAHAANIVTAIFLATGQDPAQNVESSNCITIMKNYNGNLQITVSMPSIEVGTVGGGTILEPQGAMLDFLGVRGPHPTSPGDNARKLARIIAAAVLAGELSLCSALAAGHLVKSHMAHNRSAPATRAGTPAPAMHTSSSALSLTSGRIATPVTMAMASMRERAAQENLGRSR